MIFDATHCQLGEGPLWHPVRKQLFWCDILGKRLHTKGQHWDFDTYVSAAGWVDHDTLIVATANGLYRFDLRTGDTTLLCNLEARNAATRSNDGRADPQGGFWIGTMGVHAQMGAGAIYRYYRGELRVLFTDLQITNAICFAPSGDTAYFADTNTQMIMAVALDADGWPKGDPRIHIDLRGTDFRPDGAVVDSVGNLFSAQWGVGRVAVYDPQGTFTKAFPLPALQSSCPAFGGADLSTLFCTTAAVGLDGPDDGQTYQFETSYTGQAEHRVILG
jgi:sugar lactone lactonase YvrE